MLHVTVPPSYVPSPRGTAVRVGGDGHRRSPSGSGAGERNAPECGGGCAEAQEQMGESAREVGLHGGCRAEGLRAVHRWTGKLAKDGSGVLPPFELDGAMAEEMGCERDPRLQESRIVQIPEREVDGQRCTEVRTDCAEARTECAEARTGRAGNA